MFIVLLKFSENKKLASDFMEDHRSWIKKGLDDGIFLLVGSLQPNQGGGILASNTTPSEIELRVKEDPFVVQNIVTYEILEITPSMADERLQFLMNKD